MITEARKHSNELIVSYLLLLKEHVFIKCATQTFSAHHHLYNGGRLKDEHTVSDGGSYFSQQSTMKQSACVRNSGMMACREKCAMA